MPTGRKERYGFDDQICAALFILQTYRREYLAAA